MQLEYQYTDPKTGIEYISKKDSVGTCESCEFNYDQDNCGKAALVRPCSLSFEDDGVDSFGIIWIKKYPEENKEIPNISCSNKADSPLQLQVGGEHYKSQKIQPVEYIHANNLGFCEGNVVKYITRWREKGGKADIEKVIHYCQLLMQLEGL